MKTTQRCYAHIFQPISLDIDDCAKKYVFKGMVSCHCLQTYTIIHIQNHLNDVENEDNNMLVVIYIRLKQLTAKTYQHIKVHTFFLLSLFKLTILKTLLEQICTWKRLYNTTDKHADLCTGEHIFSDVKYSIIKCTHQNGICITVNVHIE